MVAALRNCRGARLVIAFMIPAKVQKSAHKSITTSSAGVRTDGSGFTVLCNISQGFGAGGLVVTNNTIYGTSYYGGTSDTGTIFKFSLLPQLTITASGPNTILAWPTNPTGFSLQSTASLTTSASWTTVSPGPVVVNGQNTVTNPISGAQQFFRLSQ
jgi:uncharacterized repeat protein (TIGR03803 family)